MDAATRSLFVTDYDNHRVQVFDIETRKFFRTIGSGLGSGPGQMNQPIVPHLDEETGFLYVADYSNNRVQVFDKDTGVYIRQIGGGGVGGNMTGLGTDALNGPRGLCIDGPSGLLFIADREVWRMHMCEWKLFMYFIILPLLLSMLLVIALKSALHLTDLHAYILLSCYSRITGSRSMTNQPSFSYGSSVTAKGLLPANFIVPWKFVLAVRILLFSLSTDIIIVSK
jgi:hypothetical protein